MLGVPTSKFQPKDPRIQHQQVDIHQSYQQYVMNYNNDGIVQNQIMGWRHWLLLHIFDFPTKLLNYIYALLHAARR